MNNVNKNKCKTLLDWALYYESINLSVIPVGKDKKPKEVWSKYQKERASQEKIKDWWKKYPDANIGIVTGEISNIVVLDFDKKHNRSSKEFKLPITACSKTGNDGEHFFFKHPKFEIKNSTAIDSKEGLDFRGDGGYVVVAPSVNEKGGKYEWIISLEDEIVDLPEQFIKLLTKDSSTEKKWLIGIDGVSEGERNDTAISVAGKIISNMNDEKLIDILGWNLFVIWNNKNKPPINDDELKIIWESAKKMHNKNKSKFVQEKTNQADRLVELIENDSQICLFHNESKEAFISFFINDHYEYWSCESSDAKQWLAKKFWNTYKKAINNDSLRSALHIIQAKAKFENPEYALSNRIARFNEDIWYDLTNKEWQAIKITNNEWTIENNPPILFKRYNHQKPQVMPTHDGDVLKLLEFINIKRKEHKILLLVYIISCFIPDFPHPIIYFFGPQGSAKSTASKLLRKIIDPSLLEAPEMPKDTKEIIQQCSHNWFMVFDNVSYISSEISDLLCRVVSGNGFSKRKLYSDDDDIIYNFKRCIGLNGINLLALKPDLLDRCVLLELDRVKKEERRNEEAILKDFEKELPLILGGILDSIVKAKTIYKKIKQEEISLPRMADFTLWGCAIAEALGYTKEEFLESYLENINIQHEEIINDNFVASFIVDLIRENGEWQGSASELLSLMKGTDRDKELPKSASSLSRTLNTLKTNLEECGIFFEKTSGQKRLIIIRGIEKNDVNAVNNLDELFDNF